MTIAEIKLYEHKTVTLRLSNGEITTAKILHVDDEYSDLVVNIISTNRQDTYRDPDSVYAIAVADLVSAEEEQSRGQ
jgi:hypothetical protein